MLVQTAATFQTTLEPKITADVEIKNHQTLLRHGLTDTQT